MDKPVPYKVDIRSETIAARRKFTPAIRSNTILPTLHKANAAQNGITTTVGASLPTALCRISRFYIENLDKFIQTVKVLTLY